MLRLALIGLLAATVPGLQPPPTAEEIIARAIAQTGGRAAIESITSITAEWHGQGRGERLTMRWAAPDRVRWDDRNPLGLETAVDDGATRWTERFTRSGYRCDLVDGPPPAIDLRVPHRILIDLLRACDRASVERLDWQGRACYRVVPEELATTLPGVYFDVENGCLVGLDQGLAREGGREIIRHRFGEWTTHGPIEMFSRWEIRSIPELREPARVLTLKRVALDPVDAAAFDTPASVAKLARRRHGAPPAAPDAAATRPVMLSFNRVTIHEIMPFLVEQGARNVTVHGGVEGYRMTLGSAEQMTRAEALERVLDQMRKDGLEVVENDEAIVIGPG